MTIVRNAANIARTRLRATQGRQAVITSGNSSCSAVVILARTDVIAASVKELIFAANSQEILILAADYKPGGTPVMPSDGDRITVTIDGIGVPFDVRPPSDSQQCYQIADAEWLELRVHCKRVTAG